MGLIKPRALIKTITYRIIVGIAGLLIVWLFTGNLILTLSVSLTSELVRSVLYYAHEIVWGWC